MRHLVFGRKNEALTSQQPLPISYLPY